MGNLPEIKNLVSCILYLVICLLYLRSGDIMRSRKLKSTSLFILLKSFLELDNKFVL